jgi:hypothetical protein
MDEIMTLADYKITTNEFSYGRGEKAKPTQIQGS